VNRCLIRENGFGRWYLANATHPNLAWSGSRWVSHVDGNPVAIQICNFDTPLDALIFAETHNMEVCELEENPDVAH